MATTYVVAATRAGQSAVVNETASKTFALAPPVVLKETAVASTTAQPRVIVMA